MPVHDGFDRFKMEPYVQWGDHGKKYYHHGMGTESYVKAINKAIKQGKAIFMHKSIATKNK